ncbi:MAG: DinB family protein [Ignavibacteriales bacterium]
MEDFTIEKPGKTEYAEYYEQYVSAVPEGNILRVLEQQLVDSITLLEKISEEKAGYRYAPGKWSIKQVVGHITDAERIFAYRALRFARNDQNRLPGFEQDDYVKWAEFDNISLKDLALQLQAVRQSTIYMLKSFPAEAWLRRGYASNFEVSVRALAYIMAGHLQHHMEVIRTRYL